MFKYRYTCINILSYDVKSCCWSFNNYSIKKSFLDLMHFQKRKIADCGSKLKVLRLLIDLLFNSSKFISLTFVIEILHWFRNKATVLSDLELFPAMYMKDGSYMKVNGSIFCTNISGSTHILSTILSKASHVSKILYFLTH